MKLLEVVGTILTGNDTMEAAKKFGESLGKTVIIAQDTLFNIAVAMYDESKDVRFASPILLKKMVKAGWHGRKTGKGFYDYSQSA